MNYSKDFEEFWKLYPKRWNKDVGQWVKRKKMPAFKKWLKLSKEIRSKCLARVHLIKQYEGSMSAIRDPITWLNQEGWADMDDDIHKQPMGLSKIDIENLFKIEENTDSISNKVNHNLNKLKGMVK